MVKGFNGHHQKHEQFNGIHIHILHINKEDGSTIYSSYQGYQKPFQRYHIIFKQDTFRGLQGLQHHHVQGIHIIKNISNGSDIYLHHHKSTNTPKEGYKELTTSLRHLMRFI